MVSTSRAIYRIEILYPPGHLTATVLRGMLKLTLQQALTHVLKSMRERMIEVEEYLIPEMN